MLHGSFGSGLRFVWCGVVGYRTLRVKQVQRANAQNDTKTCMHIQIVGGGGGAWGGAGGGRGETGRVEKINKQAGP